MDSDLQKSQGLTQDVAVMLLQLMAIAQSDNNNALRIPSQAVQDATCLQGKARSGVNEFRGHVIRTSRTWQRTIHRNPNHFGTKCGTKMKDRAESVKLLK